MNFYREFLTTACVGAAVCLCSCYQPVFAQRTPSSELDLLRRDDIRDQLSLTDEQRQKLEELQRSSSPGREVFDPFLKRMAEVDTEEERAKIREEMNQAVAKSRTSFQDQAVEILTAPQKATLRGLFIESAGIRALSDAKIAAELGLTDEQKTALVKLSDERRVASQSLGFNTTDEARTAFEEEWKGKFRQVLTPEQKASWDKQAATAVAASGANAGASTSGNAAGTGVLRPESIEPPPGEQSLSSFGSAAETTDGAQPVEKFSFNFRYAPWEQVLENFATAAGYTLDMAVIPPGTFNHIDNNSYTADQTLDVLNGYLLRKGYTLLKNNRFLVCLNVDKGIPPILIPDVDVEKLNEVGEHEIVRIELSVDNVDVAIMAQEVEALLGPYGKMTAFTQTGTLIISDSGGNLRRVSSFLRKSLEKKRPNDLLFKSYYVRNLAVEEAEFLLLTQFGMRQGVANVSAANESRGRSSQPSPPPSAAAAPTLQVASDARTNSLFVTGTSVQHTLVEEILKAIDVSETPGGEPLDRFSNSGPYLRVYNVQGDAGEVAKSLNAMMPGVVVNEDRRNGRVHIWATAKQQTQVEEWIQQFNGSGGSAAVAVIPLVKMDPLSAASTLRSLFLSDGASAPTIETDLYGRRIIVRGTAEQVNQIKAVLAQLGEDGTGTRTTGSGGTTRRYSLQGRSSNEMLKYLQQEWESSEPNPIRVLVPPRQSPIKELRTPKGLIPQKAEEESARGQDSTRLESDRFLREQAVAGAGLANHSENYLPASVSGNSVDEADEPVGQVVQKNAENVNLADDVNVIVMGDELVLNSSDEAALDRMEELLDMLQQALPFRPAYTVIYLQSADATEAASMLEQLIPSASVSTSSSAGGFSLGGMFSPVTDTVSNLTGLSGLGTSGQTLRIIPDIRSNSLFVTGPESVVQEVADFLRVLDSNDVPESLRDMQPRTIEVRYADIDEVSRIITDVFKPFMEAAGGRQQQNNPFAMLMGGGGGGGGRGNEASQVRMTLGVDRQTSSLIISSSESLFGQIRQLVDNLDDAARAANRSIRVVQLKNADATVVQQSLSSLFPRVTSSATRPSGGDSAPDGGQRGGGDDRSSQQQDAFQRMMQERMRQQMQGGGDGGGGRPTFGRGDATGGGGFPGGTRSGRGGR